MTKKRNDEKAFAVVRIDLFHGDDVAWENRVTVKRVYWTQAEAEAEAERLNQVNHDKQCTYFWQQTRVTSQE